MFGLGYRHYGYRGGSFYGYGGYPFYFESISVSGPGGISVGTDMARVGAYGASSYYGPYSPRFQIAITGMTPQS
jgi:hypothetical protein